MPLWGVLLPLGMAAVLLVAMLVDDSRPPIRPAQPSGGAGTAGGAGPVEGAVPVGAAMSRWTKAR